MSLSWFTNLELSEFCKSIFTCFVNISELLWYSGCIVVAGLSGKPVNWVDKWGLNLT